MAEITLSGDRITGRGTSLNPFVLLDDAHGFIGFATAVFGAHEVEQARTATPGGLLIHAELRLGDALLLLADRQPGWPPRPGLLQLWIDDASEVITRAEPHGATVVTPPTPFYGSLTLARLLDPWGNLWWLYEPVPGQPDPRPAWEGGDDTVFRTLDEHLRASGG
ncbi:hypothetical protein GCM10027515_10910 [Schumannella luteola]|uniref:Putative glyoxalase superfamily protein PhnB n=1 Tax=Schumannella luteola TaxID=472059 RepID=A0A852Y829_9MICO|nr:VOC family protein [Schumannella luteola]NYG97540.1 putative glyoxalase superfamily protein PhnB [Schumannella luteola]TPX01605.1 hypothetical protein FJ656_26920 [Schumannella luteola]